MNVFSVYIVIKVVFDLRTCLKPFGYIGDHLRVKDVYKRVAQ